MSHFATITTQIKDESGDRFTLNVLVGVTPPRRNVVAMPEA